MRTQQTIRRPVSVSGAGYWTGHPVTVEFMPAPAGSGVVFVRMADGVAVRIPAVVDHRVEAAARTNLAAAGVGMQMVEHVLSALAGLGVDCCVVRVDAEEMPGLDGSALAFVEALDAAGIESLGAPLSPLVVTDTHRVGDDASWVEVSPPRFAGLSVEYELDYGPGPIGRQTLALRVTPETYRRELAAARTFISQDEAARLRAAGLARTVGYGDLLVFGPDGPVENSLRWPDECARHKVLDLVGDLALVGRPLHAHVRACRSGHRLNGVMAAVVAAGQGRRASA
ncbi:MAG: UDP-3-O-acyl-N-acetylglucosamine deacetylase [Planctomycetaceae bacterium]